MHRFKIAIIHPQLIGGGGSEACALWSVEALKNDYNVFLITMGTVNLKRLNEYFGTNLNENEITIISIPIPKLFKTRFDALRSYKLARFCKKIAPKFDLMISSYNIMDFGGKGIQFVADFSFDDKLRRAFDFGQKSLKRWFYRESFFRKCYIKFSKILSETSEEGWKKNLTIANSKWTSKIFKKYYGVDSVVIYPPVIGEFPNIPWNKKENGFLCIGRLSPEKQIENIIKILREVKKNNLDIHLHIVGRVDDSSYAKMLKRLCDENSNWCFLGGEVYAQRKLELIARHKFGISGRKNEPFGIAVAEMVKAGCIVFVPDGGGQTEIVNNDQLIYKDEEDAIRKIENVLMDSDIQIELKEQLLKNSPKFSIINFQQSIKEIVEELLKENHIS